jgi:aconitate hydratase
MATICNMGAEIGATTSLFPYNERMDRYLKATNRSGIVIVRVIPFITINQSIICIVIAEEAFRFSHLCIGDESSHYDRVIEINLSELEPRINGPFTPDISTPISQMKRAVETHKWPIDISVVFELLVYKKTDIFTF